MAIDPEHSTLLLNAWADSAPLTASPSNEDGSAVDASDLDTVHEAEAARELLPLVYDKLHELARGYLRRERRDHTLQPTALVHEAYLKLIDQKRVQWAGRQHFFALGARFMRRILIDHARERRASKRGGDQLRVTLTEGLGGPGRELSLEELLTLDEALQQLAEADQREARVVELRYFAGMTVDEVAAVLGVSRRTVEGDWTHARAWLRRRLTGSAVARAPPS